MASWPGESSIRGGSAEAQLSCANRQRVRNRQPPGGASGEAGSPCSTTRPAGALAVPSVGVAAREQLDGLVPQPVGFGQERVEVWGPAVSPAG